MPRLGKYIMENIEVQGSKGRTFKERKSGRYTGLTLWNDGTVSDFNSRLKLNIREKITYNLPLKIPKFPSIFKRK